VAGRGLVKTIDPTFSRNSAAEAVALPMPARSLSDMLAGSIHDHIGPVILSLAFVAALTGGLLVLEPVYKPVRTPTVYLLPVLFAAIRWGMVPAVIAAFAGALATIFFFCPPIYNFFVEDPEQIASLALFIVVAMVTSQLAGNVRQQASISRKREKEVRDLYAFSRRLAGVQTAADIYAAIQEHLSTVIGHRVVIFGAAAEAGMPLDPVPPEVQRAAVDAAARREHAVATTLVDPETGATWLVRPVLSTSPEFGVIAVELGGGSHEAVDAIAQHIDLLMDDAAATFERLDVGRALNEAKLRADANQLRDALIGSVSHELRTPLASILGAAAALAQTPMIADEPRLNALATIARDEAEHLNTDIQNLLDATRISAEAVRPKLEWTDLTDVINAAIERKSRRLSLHKLDSEVPCDLPFLHVDPILLQQAIEQVLDNAAKYSAAGSTIAIRAARDDGQVTISIADRGEGLTDDEKARLGQRFFRGTRHVATTSGSGLGLWIAKAFVAAIGGAVAAESAGERHGTTVSIRLPILQEPARHVKELNE
jgi:two-component system, OmpR family, sensor histidine kinase KdpD